MKEKKICPICGDRFLPVAGRYKTCGRPCYLLMQARSGVRFAERKLAKARERLEKIEQKWNDGKLPTNREPALKMEIGEAMERLGR